MTDLSKDAFRIYFGVSDEAIARREWRIEELKGEQKKCRNPFRKQLLHEAIISECKELASLRNLQETRPKQFDIHNAAPTSQS